MRLFILLVFLLSSKCFAYQWQTNQIFYLFANSYFGVALTTNRIHSVDHIAGGYTSVQIGDQTGVLTNYCTGLVSDQCGFSQACEWNRLYKAETNDIIHFVTCRPMTLGITTIATNIVENVTRVSWFSNARRIWISGTIINYFGEHTANLSDGSKAWNGLVIFDGPQAISQDSGSPVFTENGDFVCSVTSITNDGRTVGGFAYPEGSQYSARTYDVGSGDIFTGIDLP